MCSKQLVTREDFKRFVEVQKSGVCNMLSSRVEKLAGLTQEQHLYIIQHYEELEKEFDIHCV